MFMGRDKEEVLLTSIAREDGSQFVAVYGRRRIGKTMLIRESSYSPSRKAPVWRSQRAS